MTNHPNRNWRSKVPSSLVRSWLEMELSVPGRTRADALRDLNAEFSGTYTNSRLNEWLRGDRAPDHKVRQYMLRCVLERVLRQEGIEGLSDKQLDRMADSLS